MPEWFQIFDANGTCVYEVLAYTPDGALKDARSRGIEVPFGSVARKLFSPVARFDWDADD